MDKFVLAVLLLAFVLFVLFIYYLLRSFVSDRGNSSNLNEAMINSKWFIVIYVQTGGLKIIWSSGGVCLLHKEILE